MTYPIDPPAHYAVGEMVIEGVKIVAGIAIISSCIAAYVAINDSSKLKQQTNPPAQVERVHESGLEPIAE